MKQITDVSQLEPGWYCVESSSDVLVIQLVAPADYDMVTEYSGYLHEEGVYFLANSWMGGRYTKGYMFEGTQSWLNRCRSIHQITELQGKAITCTIK